MSQIDWYSRIWQAKQRGGFTTSDKEDALSVLRGPGIINEDFAKHLKRNASKYDKAHFEDMGLCSKFVELCYLFWASVNTDDVLEAGYIANDIAVQNPFDDTSFLDRVVSKIRAL